jgi:hypothetical protein
VPDREVYGVCSEPGCDHLATVKWADPRYDLDKKPDETHESRYARVQAWARTIRFLCAGCYDKVHDRWLAEASDPAYWKAVP